MSKFAFRPGSGDIMDPSEIKRMGWMGSHTLDGDRFDTVHRYLKREKDPRKQKQALHAMGKHGMGIEEWPSDKETKEYLDNI